MSQAIDIAPLVWAPPTIETLAEILVAVVADGGSLGFMHPLPMADAEAFWDESLERAGLGDRVVLGARLDGHLVATVTLGFAPWPNQPHRAEIAKLMTAPEHRGRGIATALMGEAERVAADRRRTLLTLDTAEEDGAAGLYERLGYERVGLIPGFALRPYGVLTGTVVYYKQLEAAA